MSIVFTNGFVYTDDFQKKRLDVKIENDTIVEIGENLTGDTVYNLNGRTLIPGLIDIHIHGREGVDTCDGKIESLDTMSKSLARLGITSFCPTTMTVSQERLKRVFETLGNFRSAESGAYIHGVNMEGPYIFLGKKGAQSGEFVRVPDIEEFEKLNALCKVCLVDVAPEVDGALEFAQKASKTTVVSVAHTGATYEETVKAFENGFSHVTHLYNAMTPLTSRFPGVVGATFDHDTAMAELICDGFHIAPASLRVAFRQLGYERSVIVSDSMMAAGLADGDYDLGGQTVFVRDGNARLADGTIAASTTNIHQELKKAISYGIPLEQALRSCTINPAKAIRVDKETGSLTKGKTADILVVDDAFDVQDVFIRGKIYER